MTLVCCWLDQSTSRERITAIADARASFLDGNDKWQVLNETTTKLLPVTVSCHELATQFDPGTSRFANPYYTTEICVGYSGYAFEALSIIELFRRCCGQLMSTGTDRPQPSSEGLTQLFVALCDRYFKQHKRPKEQRVDFILFGYSGGGAAWCTVLKHLPERKTTIERRGPLSVADAIQMGDGQSATAMAALGSLRASITRQARKVADRMDPGFEQDLEQARLILGDRKLIEDRVLEVLESQFMETVGGVLQKLELYFIGSGRAAAAYSQNDQEHMLFNLPMVAKDLGYAPITEHMGR